MDTHTSEYFLHYQWIQPSVIASSCDSNAFDGNNDTTVPNSEQDGAGAAMDTAAIREDCQAGDVPYYSPCTLRETMEQAFRIHGEQVIIFLSCWM